MAASIPIVVRHALVRDQAQSAAGAWVTCASESMTPTIVPGQRVRVRAVRRVRVGDIVLFETNDKQQLVLHRVVFAPPGLDWLVHVGDAGQRAGIVARARIVGVADLPNRRPGLTALRHVGTRLFRATLRAATGRGSRGHR